MHQQNWKALELYAILIDLNHQLSKRLHYNQPEFLRNAQEKSIGPLKFYLDAFLMKSLQKRYEKKPMQCWIRMERKAALRKTASAETKKCIDKKQLKVEKIITDKAIKLSD